MNPTSSVSSLLGSIGGKTRHFLMKGEICLPEGAIGSGKASRFAIVSYDSSFSMSSSSSIVKPNKMLNPILFYSIVDEDAEDAVGEDVGDEVGEDVADVVGEDIGCAR